MNFPALGIRRKLALMTLMSLLPLLLLGVALSVYLISDTLRQNNLRQEVGSVLQMQMWFWAKPSSRK